MDKTVFRNVCVATVDDSDTVLESVDVLVEGATIVSVGEAVASAPDLIEVDATGKLLVPGFVDVVQNMWQGLFRGRASLTWGVEYYSGFVQPLTKLLTPQDCYNGIYATALESLYNGVTSVGNYHHASHSREHIEAGLEAMIASGIRGRLVYDLGNASTTPDFPRAARRAHLEELAARVPADSLVTLAAGITRPMTEETRAEIAEDIELARGLGLPIVYHESTSGQHVQMERWGLLGPDMSVIHGNFATDADIKALADHGVVMSATPEAETTSGRRSMTHIPRMLAAGGRVAIGSDVPGQVQPGLLAQMRLTFIMQRVLDGMRERYEGRYEPQRYPGIPSLPIEGVHRMATVNGAVALGYPTVGTITAGAAADFVLVDAPFGISENGPATHLAFYASYGDFTDVVVGGEYRKKDGKLVTEGVAEAVAASLASRDEIFARGGTAPSAFGQAHHHWVQ